MQETVGAPSGGMVGIPTAASKRVTWAGVALIVLTGLLNFHVPHFLLESPRSPGSASSLLELVYLANVLGALMAAVGIARHRRWGWLLGLLVAAVSFLLYVAQETVGLPGLPKMWLEPSRLLSLVVEGLFVALALNQGVGSGSERPDVSRSESLS